MQRRFPHRCLLLSRFFTLGRNFFLQVDFVVLDGWHYERSHFARREEYRMGGRERACTMGLSVEGQGT